MIAFRHLLVGVSERGNEGDAEESGLLADGIVGGDLDGGVEIVESRFEIGGFQIVFGVDKLLFTGGDFLVVGAGKQENAKCEKEEQPRAVPHSDNSCLKKREASGWSAP